MDPSLLRLTKVDDEIYTKFRETFPDMKVDVINEDEMKAASSKEVDGFLFYFVQWNPYQKISHVRDFARYS